MCRDAGSPAQKSVQEKGTAADKRQAASLTLSIHGYSQEPPFPKDLQSYIHNTGSATSMPWSRSWQPCQLPSLSAATRSDQAPWQKLPAHLKAFFSMVSFMTNYLN